MRFFSLLPILGLMACGPAAAFVSPVGTTAGGATGSAGSGTGGATGVTSSGTGNTTGTGTIGTTGTGSGGSVAASSTGPSPIGLWLGGSAAVNATELSLGGDQMLSDSCPPPDPDADPAGAAAFDGQGNLWVQYPSATNPIYMWTASQLGQECASGKPAVKLTSDSFGLMGEGFSAIAFDSQGNLWCVNPGNLSPGAGGGEGSAVVGFRASDLALSGRIEPAWGLQGGGSMIDTLIQPIGLAFDAVGNLWIGNAYSVIAYSPSTLEMQVTQVAPDGGVVLGSVSADLQITNLNDIADLQTSAPVASFAYRYLAFDASGDLWVTVDNKVDGGVNQIVEFSGGQLGALSSTDDPIPVRVLSATAANAVAWGPLAFDSSGSLWAGVAGGQPDLYRFSTHGSQPDLSLTVPGGSAASLSFDPIPRGLPIQP